MPDAQAGIAREDFEASALLKQWWFDEGRRRRTKGEGGEEREREPPLSSSSLTTGRTGFGTWSQFCSCSVHIDTWSSILHFDPSAKLNVPLLSVSPGRGIVAILCYSLYLLSTNFIISWSNLRQLFIQQ